MSKYDFRPKFECQTRISNAKIRYLLLVPMLRLDFDCLNSILGPSSNVKIGLRMSKYDIRPQFECQNRISNVKIDIRSQFECQNRILIVKMRYTISKYQNLISNVKIRYSAQFEC